MQELLSGRQLIAVDIAAVLRFFKRIAFNSLSVAHEHRHTRRVYWALTEHLYNGFDATVGAFA